MTLTSSTSLTQQQNFGDNCRKHLQTMALLCTTNSPEYHKDFCDECGNKFQNLTLQSVTQDHHMVDVGHHGYDNVKPFTEHDDDLKTTTNGKVQSDVASVAESESNDFNVDVDGDDYDHDYLGHNHDKCLELPDRFDKMDPELYLQIFGKDDCYCVTTKSEDEKSNLSEMEEDLPLSDPSSPVSWIDPVWLFTDPPSWTRKI